MQQIATKLATSDTSILKIQQRALRETAANTKNNTSSLDICHYVYPYVWYAQCTLSLIDALCSTLVGFVNILGYIAAVVVKAAIQLNPPTNYVAGVLCFCSICCFGHCLCLSVVIVTILWLVRFYFHRFQWFSLVCFFFFLTSVAFSLALLLFQLHDAFSDFKFKSLLWIFM